jgi:diadenosine hexaphosphate hydrolase (ATP-forming)
MAPQGVAEAGAVAFRLDGDEIGILLVRAMKDPSVWIFPKGHIEPGETPQQTACREAAEEAGVTGDVIGSRISEPIEFENRGEIVRVEYFLLRARSESRETDGREKRWFRLEDARAMLAFESARRVLENARQRIVSGPPADPCGRPGSQGTEVETASVPMVSYVKGCWSTTLPNRLGVRQGR